MIVVAIIGILAAIAIPAYQDYTIRAQVSEGLSVAAAAKVAVAERFSQSGFAATGTNPSYGLAAAGTIVGNNVSSVTIGRGGQIAIAYTALGAGLGVQTLTLNPTGTAAGGSLTWNCAPGAATFLPKYLPQTCRNAVVAVAP